MTCSYCMLLPAQADGTDPRRPVPLLKRGGDVNGGGPSAVFRAPAEQRGVHAALGRDESVVRLVDAACVPREVLAAGARAVGRGERTCTVSTCVPGQKPAAVSSARRNTCRGARQCSPQKSMPPSVSFAFTFAYMLSLEAHSECGRHADTTNAFTEFRHWLGWSLSSS